MRIGIDIDDTIAYSNDYLMDMALEYDKNHVKGKGFKNKDAYRFVDLFYWTKEDVKKFFEHVRKSEFATSVEPIPEAIEYINKLHDEGNEIIFITSRLSEYDTDEHKTATWLNKNNIKYEKLFMDGKDKGKICKENKVDLFIDNSIEHIRSANDRKIDTILYGTVHNKDYKVKKRIDNWPEIYTYIKEMKTWEE